MVYWVKCGAKNSGDTKVRAECRTFLCSAEKRRYYQRIEDECFGIPRGGSIVSLVFGVMIILAGVSFFIQEVYDIVIPWWPLMIILVGLLMIVGAFFRLRRR